MHFLWQKFDFYYLYTYYIHIRNVDIGYLYEKLQPPETFAPECSQGAHTSKKRKTKYTRISLSVFSVGGRVRGEVRVSNCDGVLTGRRLESDGRQLALRKRAVVTCCHLV